MNEDDFFTLVTETFPSLKWSIIGFVNGWFEADIPGSFLYLSISLYEASDDVVYLKEHSKQANVFLGREDLHERRNVAKAINSLIIRACRKTAANNDLAFARSLLRFVHAART